jgi:NAD(P)H dehydrogenase (quinone)
MILIILGHPDPASFNHAIAEAACDALRQAGHTVAFHDLQGERFDPCLPRQEIPQSSAVPDWLRLHCEELRTAEGIVIVHPNWWGQPPAILKGWIDRVFRPGVAYRFDEGDSGEGVPVGLLRARTALILNTSNTPEQREREAFGDPLEAIWKRCIFDLCGVSDVQRRMFSVVVTSSDLQRALWLDEVRNLVRECFPPPASPGC